MSEAKSPKADAQLRRSIAPLLAIIVVILTAWALKATFYVTMPMACAFFIAVMVRPVQVWLDRRLPSWLQWLSVAVAMFTILAAIALVVGSMVGIFFLISDDLPKYYEKMGNYWNSGVSWAKAHNLPIKANILETGTVKERLMAMIAAILQSIWTLTALAVLMFFLVLLMLLETSEWRRKSRRALRPDNAHNTLNTMEAIAGQVRSFLWINTLTSIISGVVEGFWLWILGVDFAILWGFLLFLLNYIPYIGSVLAYGFILVIALIQFKLGWVLFVMIGLFVIDQTIGNFITPKIMGDSLKLSPVVVLASISFWGWVWGVVGTFIAIPMTATLVIICQHVESLKPIGILLSRAPDADKKNPEGNK